MNIPRIAVIRVDASLTLGLGHVTRCLTLANKLVSYGWKCLFICKRYIGHQADMIKKNGHEIILLPPDTEHGFSISQDIKQTIEGIQLREVDLLIVDHYALDACWHRELRAYVNKIMVIDDLANRPYDCDILLDQTFNRSRKDYESFIKNDTITCIGSKYVLLRSQFQMDPEVVLRYRLAQTSLQKILLMLGGSDPDNYTEILINTLLVIKDISITVVLGKNYLHCHKLEQFILRHKNVKILYNVTDMAKVMLNHDICVGAAGSATWERCVCGLPGILVSLADNQNTILKVMASCGAVQILNDINSSTEMLEKLNYWRNKLERYYQCIRKNLEICDAYGVNRVIMSITNAFESTGSVPL